MKKQFLQRALMLLFSIMLISPQVWADDFSVAEMVANTGSGTTKNHVNIKCVYTTTTSTKVCNTSVTVAQINSNANSSYNASNSYIEIIADEGYTISSPISITGNAGSTTATPIAIVFWTGTASATFSSVTTATLPSNAATSGCAVDVEVPSGTRTIRIYKQIKYKGNSFSSETGYTTAGNGGGRYYSNITASASPAAAASTWYVKGGWNGWGTTDNLKGSGTEVSATVNITTAGLYEFKIWNNSGGDGTWYGNGGNIGCNVTDWTFSTSDGNCNFFASETGNYTFTFNTSTKKLSVTYPTAQGKYYYKNTSSWGTVAVYRYKSSIDNGWPGTQVVETETICGDTYYFTYADPGTTIIFNNNVGGSQTGNMAASGNAGKYVSGTGSSWTAFTYNVTYDKNGGTGSVPTDATNYTSGTSVSVKDNTGGLAKSGYYFAGWNTKADGSGTTYMFGETFSITSCTTLYAKWTAVTCPDGSEEGTVFSLTSPTGTVSVPASSSATITSTQATVSKGLATMVNGQSSAKNLINSSKFNFPNGNTVLRLNLGCALAKGDVISFTGANYKLMVSKTNSTSPGTDNYVTQPSKTENCTIPAGSNLIGLKEVYIVRAEGSTTTCTAITITRPAGCTAPTALAASSVTAKGATLTVTDEAEDGDDYEFYVSTSSTAPTAGSSATHTATGSKSITITSCVANTTYYAWARTKCSASNKSDWVALTGNTFTTSTVTMTPSLTNVAHTGGATSSIGGSDYTAVFTANTGYSMPNPTVTIGGNAATSGTHYTWSVDGSVGTISIPANKINGNIVITLNSVPSAPSSATISGAYHYFPGESISLTVTPTGNNGPTTYQWYKGGKADGNRIDGATSATYTKNSCTFDDAGSYYCKVTCNATSIWAVTNSHENYDVKILRLYVNGSKGGEHYGYVDFVKVDGTTATASISLGSNWTYGFNIADGCGHYYGNAGTMQYNNYGPWVTDMDGTDCGLTTTNAATYIFTINYSNLSRIETSVTFPVVNQAAGKVIYFDNNVLKWTGSSIYYRIGHSSHSQADQLSLVPGTANLYKMTTREYNGFFAWQIGNAEGGNGSIYNTKNTPAITASIAYEGGAVTAAAVTVTPGEDHSTGGDDQNNNCEFYSKTITDGMKTQNVSITAPSNGTLTVNYVDVSGAAQAFSSGNRDLAHTCIITVTAVPAAGYSEPATVSINGASHGNRDPYTITGTTVVAATFSPASYTVTLNTNGGTINAGNVTSYTYSIGATLPTNVTKDGFTFDGWYDNSGLTGSAVTTISTTATGNKEYWAKWTEDVAPCPTGGDIFTLEMTYSGGSAVKVAANSTLAMTATHGTATGGTVTFGNQNGSSNDKMQIKKPGIAYINGDDAYIRIDFSCPIKTGDVLTFTSDENKEISFTTTDTRSTSVKTSSKKWTVTKAFNDATTLYIWRGSSSSVNLHTINIVRPVTVTFDKNGGSSVSPSSATYDGTSSSVLATPVRADYHLVGWNTRADGSGIDLGLPGEVYHLDVTTNTATVYAKWVEKSCASGTIYKFQVATSLTNDAFPHQEEVYIKTSDYLANLTGGYLKGYNSSSSSDYLSITNNQYICIGNSSSYLLVQLDCPLRAGDKIKSTVTTQTLYVTKADVSRTNTVTLPIAANNEQTIPEALVGATELKIWSGSSNGGKISYFEIIRSASTYNVTYDGNDQTSAAGTVPTDATNYAYNATVTTAAQGSLAKTNYTFGGWNTANDGTGTNTAAGSTFSITDNTTLYAKWTQAVTFDANTANHGSTGGSATAVWNTTGLTGITHATPASGYKLLGYYTAATSGTKVLNSDGSFAATAVDGYVTDGKWSRTGTAPTLYAQYESAGALTWNLVVKSDTSALSTSTKSSAFTEIAVANMTNAALTGLTYTKSSKSSLTGKISTPASYDADKYVKVTFKVADGYKFIPSSIKVIAQPVTTGKDVKLSLTDGASHSLVSSSATSISGGSTQTVTLAGDGTYFTGTVTLKIYCYGATDAYRLGTPITIEGEIEEACGTMPSYTSMSYTTTTFAPNADASGSPITIVGGDNINTYQWKYNTVNDRTSGTNCGTGTSLTPLTDASATTDGTRYYWCEMTNDACGITIKSPAVAITVAAAKSDATVTWTDPASTPNYGGGGYTIKATVDQTGWDGNAADLVITAPAGINIYNVTSGTTSSQKWVQADFDVQTSFDRSTYASNIPFTVSAAATATYNAISDEKDVDYSACTGGSASEELMPVNADSVNSTVKGWRFAGTGKMWFGHGSSTPSTGSSNIKSLSNTMAEGNIDHYYNSGGSYFSFYTEKAITGVRLYVYTSNSNVKVSNVYIANSQFATGTPSSGAVTYEVVYNDDNEGLDKGDNVYSAWAEITFASEVAAGKYGLIKLDNNVKIAGIGLISTSGGGATLNTYLQWSGGLADGATVAKYTTDAYFTYSASKITENTNTLGAITYSSSKTSVATVDATGKVALVAAGSTTIKATLAASGCYKKAEISYTLNVTEVPCAITAGTLTLTSGTESKCSSDNVTLTLTGFESGASIQWKDGDTDINNGGNYTIATDGTTSTLTTNQEGTYSVMVTSGCSVRSNRITISNKSTEVGAKRIVKNWYIKNGRLTPDIELWTLQNGAHLNSVAWDPANATGLTASDFYESDGKVYLKGKEPSSNTSGADINYTLTLTVEDDCGSTTAMSASGQLIYLHHQKNTDKHVLAFVVNGTDKGGFTEGITAAQTTSVPLYNEIAANFDVLATNIKSTDDEQALKEYYSQFDILCVTDYPNTGDKGVNKKSYVDALGALVDIRPILTMEAWVSKLANWKAKGISGTPKSPTTRQYTMLLQCKDHEIFSGTKLTKVGEGDETMYRVSMVDNTQEEYVSLDATYGDGAHADKSGYEYASKPALQGFTFTKEMLDNDLLPLGLIDDGSGNDLQVGIERQTEMEARLMVLGINSYAMERLTDDGQTVVVNALRYLMKKNSEDIADCSNTFVGGDDEEDVSTRYDWNVDSHWSGNAVPDRTQKVRIVAPCVIKADEKFHVTGVVIAPSGKYNHGANTASGSLTIAAGGALIVDGKVEAATAPLYTETRATSPSDLTIQASSTKQGALIFDNSEGETQATVEMYSPSYWEVQDGTNKKKSYWSYVGVPIQDVPVGEYFYGAVTYLYDETSGWIRKRIGSEFHAFEGIGLSLPAGNQETFYGTLASTETKEITLTKTTGVGEGDNLIGNSWTAPIQIGNFDASDFGSATAVVSMYKTGRDDNEGNPTVVTATAENDGAVVAGQWVSIPIGLPGTDGYNGPTVIPSMQAFQVTTSSETTLTLDYDKLVRDVTIATDNLIQPMSAPKRKMKRAAKKSLDAMMRVRMSGFKTRADLWIMEDGRFSDEYDNGWEANYIECDNRSPQLYANSEIGKMAFLAKPDIEGTILGIAPSRDGNEYLFTFHYVGDEEFYLNDLKLKQSVLISEEESYSFMYEEGDANRFYISRTRIDAPQMPTGVENTHGDAVKARKFIYNNKLYIMLNGRVYSAEGQIVK